MSDIPNPTPQEIPDPQKRDDRVPDIGPVPDPVIEPPGPDLPPIKEPDRRQPKRAIVGGLPPLGFHSSMGLRWLLDSQL
jgi:hypothetical protein